jgi:hypothetical protein
MSSDVPTRCTDRYELRSAPRPNTARRVPPALVDQTSTHQSDLDPDRIRSRVVLAVSDNVPL